MFYTNPLGALYDSQVTDERNNNSVRFRWQYEPVSDLYVVYSDGRDTLIGGFPIFENRSLAVKCTRLFRF